MAELAEITLAAGTYTLNIVADSTDGSSAYAGFYVQFACVFTKVILEKLTAIVIMHSLLIF